MNVNSGTAICKIKSKPSVETKKPNNEKISTNILYEILGSFFMAKAAHALTRPTQVVKQ